MGAARYECARLTSEGSTAAGTVERCTQYVRRGRACVGVRRHLRVGSLALSMIKIIPEAVARIQASHPEIGFSFFEGAVGGIASGVRYENVDAVDPRSCSTLCSSWRSETS